MNVSHAMDEPLGLLYQRLLDPRDVCDPPTRLQKPP